MKEQTAPLGRPFLRGMRDGVPIGLGYLAVSFSLGIAVRNAGMTALQGFVLSWLGMASAGEYAAITVIAAGASYLEMAAVTVIANARYLLMSFALSQRMAPDLPLRHRLAVGYSVTDELFAIACMQPVPLNPWYSYGSYLVAIPSWAAGTAVGVAAGNLLPERVVSALSVALFGMFLAVIIPPARRDRVVLGCVLAGFACSYAAARLLPGLSGGTRTILLTLLLAGLAAALFPVPEQDSGETGDRDAGGYTKAEAREDGDAGVHTKAEAREDGDAEVHTKAGTRGDGESGVHTKAEARRYVDAGEHTEAGTRGDGENDREGSHGA